MVVYPTAKATLDAVAREMTDGKRGDELLARGLLVRYGVQQAIARATPLLASAARALAFPRRRGCGWPTHSRTI